VLPKWSTPDLSAQALAWLPFSPSLASVSFQDLQLGIHVKRDCLIIQFIFLPGNAEITDLFSCPSSKVVCCAQKSAIRELKPSSGVSVEVPQSEFSRYGKQTSNQP
jgi:hypothetical protein